MNKGAIKSMFGPRVTKVYNGVYDVVTNSGRVKKKLLQVISLMASF